MIVYFADRGMTILGQASTRLSKGHKILDDKKIEEIETGTRSLELVLMYRDKDHKSLEMMTAEGNYVLIHGSAHDEFYTIIDNEDSGDGEISIYAEEAGLDLLNEILPVYPDAEMGDDSNAHDIAYYVSRTINDTGFEIGINEIGTSTTKTLTADEMTALERLQTIVALFEAELSFSFQIEKMEVRKKIVHLYKKRGKDEGVQLRKGLEVKRIRKTSTIENVATALQIVGGTPDSGIPVTLDDLTTNYDDGDFYVADRTDYPATSGQMKLLYSRQARERWSRYIWGGEPGQTANGTGDIIRIFNYDSLDPQTLLTEGIKELTKVREPEVNYEVEMISLPDSVGVGDTIYLIDDSIELYLSARVLKMETSESQDEKVITVGDYLVQSSGINAGLTTLAASFRQRADSLAAAAYAASFQIDILCTNMDFIAGTCDLTAKVYFKGKEITDLTGLNLIWDDGATGASRTGVALDGVYRVTLE